MTTKNQNQVPSFDVDSFFNCVLLFALFSLPIVVFLTAVGALPFTSLLSPLAAGIGYLVVNANAHNVKDVVAKMLFTSLSGLFAIVCCLMYFVGSYIG